MNGKRSSGRPALEWTGLTAVGWLAFGLFVAGDFLRHLWRSEPD